MLRLSSNRMMLATLLPERDHDPSMQAMSRDSAAAPASSWRGNRTGRPHKESSVENIEKLMEGDVTSYIVSKALSAPKRDPLQLVQSLAGERLYGEILFIVRPLIYGNQTTPVFYFNHHICSHDATPKRQKLLVTLAGLLCFGCR